MSSPQPSAGAFDVRQRRWEFRILLSADVSEIWKTKSGRLFSFVIMAALISPLLARGSSSARVKRSAEAFGRGGSGVVRIGLFSSLASGFLAELLGLIWLHRQQPTTYKALTLIGTISGAPRRINITNMFPRSYYHSAAFYRCFPPLGVASCRDRYCFGCKLVFMPSHGVGGTMGPKTCCGCSPTTA